MFDDYNIWLALAALGSFVAFLAHTFIGTSVIARPLLEPSTGLSDEARFVNYYCWHLVTMTLLAQAACFAWSALPGNAVDLAVVAAALAVGFFVWSVVLNLRYRLAFATAPQWVFSLPISALGLAGVLL